MKPCEYEKFLADYVAGELSSLKNAEIKEHLLTCKVCAFKLQKFQQLHQVLIQRQRTKFPDKILREYQRNLKTLFKPKSRWEAIKDRFWEYWDSVFGIQPLWLRFAEAGALLLIGFFFGWLVFSTAPKTQNIPVKAEIITLPTSQADLELMSNFLFESEILLLQIVNSNSNGEGELADFSLTKEISQKLLMQTFFIHEKALQLQDDRILSFLTQMELLLLEISNLSDEDIFEVFKEIKQIIKDLNLLTATKNLQEILENLKSGQSV